MDIDIGTSTIPATYWCSTDCISTLQEWCDIHAIAMQEVV